MLVFLLYYLYHCLQLYLPVFLQLLYLRHRLHYLYLHIFIKANHKIDLSIAKFIFSISFSGSFATN